MENKPTVPVNCFFQGCYNPAYEEKIRECKEKCFRYNQLSPNDRQAQLEILGGLLGKMGAETVITPPFWCDYGYNISVGDYFYSNHGMVITDGAEVTFGDHVFVAPNCCFTTAEHAIDPEMRKKGIEIAKPIKIGNNVWIGANSTVLAGVVIGDNTVIGAGSVVTRSIPANVVAVGVPCRVMRPITEADRTSYPFYREMPPIPLLRKFTQADRELVAARLGLSADEAASTINEWNCGSHNGFYFEMYAVQQSDTVVGMISLYGHSGSAVSIGPEIFGEYRRRGFAKRAMTEAIRIAGERGYKIVFQQVRTDNTASIRLHESLGFEKDSGVFKNRKGNDVYIYLKVI